MNVRQEEQHFPITTRLLSAWPRFREATCDRDERAVIEWCRLTRLEHIALQRLRDQWQDAGPLETWFDGLVVRDAVLGGVLDGFTWTVDMDERLVRSFGAVTIGQQCGLREALKRERERRGMSEGGLKARIVAHLQERGLDPAGQWPHGTTKEIATALEANPGSVSTIVADLKRRAKAETNGRTPAPPANGSAPPQSLNERLASAISERGMAISDVMTETVRGEIAREIGTSPETVKTLLSRQRAEAGVSKVNRHGTREEIANRPPDPSRGRDGKPLHHQVYDVAEAITAIVLEHGSRSIEPPALREPAVALVRLMMQRKS